MSKNSRKPQSRIDKQIQEMQGMTTDEAIAMIKGGDLIMGAHVIKMAFNLSSEDVYRLLSMHFVW